MAVSVSGTMRAEGAAVWVNAGVAIVSDLNLHTELHDAFGGKPEERGRADRVARHEDEELLAPHRHAAAMGHQNRLTSQEIGHVICVDLEPAVLRGSQRIRDVGILHESV